MRWATLSPVTLSCSLAAVLLVLLTELPKQDRKGRLDADYGAPEHGGLMYVAPKELVESLREKVG